MSLLRRGDVWWYEFWFAGRRVQESSKSTSKTVAKTAEQNRRRQYNHIRMEAKRTALESIVKKSETDTTSRAANWPMRGRPVAHRSNLIAR